VCVCACARARVLVCVRDECRFTGSVKLKGIIVIGGEEDSHPAVMKLYVITNTFLTLLFICCSKQCCVACDGNLMKLF